VSRALTERTKNMSNSGLNRVKRLQALDVEIKEDRQAKKMALSQITIPTTGTLAHPRANAPIKQALVDDIVENGILMPLKVWEQTGKDGKPVFLCVDGSRRKRAGHEAEKILRESGKLAKDEELWVKVEFFEGTEIEFLLARQQADGDPLKEPHMPSVIALTFISILKIDPEFPIAKMRATCSAEYNDRIVEALTRWKSLPKEVQDAFDNGLEIEGSVRPVPIGLLPAMDKVAKEEKLDFLKELIAGGYKTFSGATKFANQKAFEETLTADEPDEPEPKAAPAAATNGSSAAKPSRARDSANGESDDTASFMIRKNACKKAYEYVVENKAPAHVVAFAAGAAFMQGLPIDTTGFPERLLAFIEGGCWQRGVKGVKAPAEVKAALIKTPPEPKQGAPKRSKGKGKKSKGKEATT
jgi:hypothetical protein